MLKIYRETNTHTTIIITTGEEIPTSQLDFDKTTVIGNSKVKPLKSISHAHEEPTGQLQGNTSPRESSLCAALPRLSDFR